MRKIVEYLRQRKVLVLIVLVTLQLLVIFDLFYDYQQNAPLNHLYGDQLLVLFLSICIGITIPGMIKDFSKLKNDSKEYDLFKQKMQTNIYTYIEEVFQTWNLSKAEKEIALFILKGMSFKDIAIFRNSAEPTVRQHATNIYKKSHLKNKSELFSFFLDDMLPDHNQITDT